MDNRNEMGPRKKQFATPDKINPYIEFYSKLCIYACEEEVEFQCFRLPFFLAFVFKKRRAVTHSFRPIPFFLIWHYRKLPNSERTIGIHINSLRILNQLPFPQLSFQISYFFADEYVWVFQKDLYCLCFSLPLSKETTHPILGDICNKPLEKIDSSFNYVELRG